MAARTANHERIGGAFEEAGPAREPASTADRKVLPAERKRDGQGNPDRPSMPSIDRRPWWQRSKGAAYMLGGAVLVMSALLTVWNAFIAPAGSP